MLEIYNETCFINNRCMYPAVSLHAYRLQPCNWVRVTRQATGGNYPTVHSKNIIVIVMRVSSIILTASKPNNRCIFFYTNAECFPFY